jgi:HSP20 family molecular chaperone IbpA
MKTTFSLALLVATCVASARTSESSWHKSITQEMERMEQAFSAMREQMNELGKEMEQVFAPEEGSDLGLKIEEKDATISIGINSLKTEALDATVNTDADQLKIKTDHDILILATDEKFLSITHTKETKKEETKDGKTAASYTSMGTYSMGQLLPERIDLNKADVSYDKKSEILTITVPYLEKKKDTKKIPVTIKK